MAERRDKNDPYQLKTPPGTSSYEMYFDRQGDKEVIVCTVGSTKLLYDARCVEDTVAFLKQHGDWLEMGGCDEQKDPKPGSLEAWARSLENPVGGWYGLKSGLRGRFGVYIPPLLEAMGLVEITHEAKNNRIRVS